jgi:hypothetical protein
MKNKIEKWFNQCSSKCFGIELPSGWIGRPFDNQHRLIDYKVEDSKVWFKFDDGREVSVIDYGNVEFTKDSAGNTLLTFRSFSKIKLLWFPYDKSINEQEVQTFSEGKITLYGYYF